MEDQARRDGRWEMWILFWDELPCAIREISCPTSKGYMVSSYLAQFAVITGLLDEAISYERLLVSKGLGDIAVLDKRAA